jgi:hypothetical protein
MGWTRIWGGLLAGGLLLLAAAPRTLPAREELTIAELKAKLSNTNIPDRPGLCIRISEKQLEAADKFYQAGESDQAKAALTDVTAFAELARDYSIQSHKHEKQAEIALRKMSRKLADLKHSVLREEQQPVQDAIDRLEKVRDDLLLAMFPKGGKK